MQSDTIQSVIAMIVMLGTLVLFHELGHYIVGRLCGFAVKEFSIGFGQKLVSFRRGTTEYMISWIPLGGYVRFYGMNRNEDVPANINGLVYWNAPVWKRFLMVAAGPLANFALAFVIFWILVMRGLEYMPAVVGDVVESGRAQQAGMLPGDKFLEVDGNVVKRWDDIERMFQKFPEVSIPVKIERQGRVMDLTITPQAVVGRSILGSISKIGRVGVALPFPSAVVSINDGKSALAVDGVRTGDRFEAWIDEAGVSHKIAGLHQTFELFTAWSKSGKDAVNVQLQAIVMRQDKDGRTKEVAESSPRTVTLHVAKWPKVNTESFRSYAMRIGATDSHLTLGVVSGPASGLLKMGDQLLKWDGVALKHVFHLNEIMREWKQPEVTLTIQRDFNQMELKVPLTAEELQLPEGKVTIYTLQSEMLGMMVLPKPEILQETNPLSAAVVAVNEAYVQTTLLAKSLWNIVTGAVPAKALGGPVMLAKVASDAAKAGWIAFLGTMAVVSINLGLVNLVPIPILDGGQIVLLGAESIKRSPISESTVENFQKIGFVIVLSLIVMVMYNDLSRYWSSMIGSIVGAK